MKENYTYPAVIDYNEEGFINITFPDFNNVCTCIQNNENYIMAAQDALMLAILDIEESGGRLPKQMRTEEINIKENQKIVYINIWMPYHRAKTKIVYTKKTLTIPTWIDELAKANNINFSATLVEAIKEKLHLKGE